MTTLSVNDLEHRQQLDSDAMRRIAGGLSFGLQQALNQFQVGLNARGSILFNPYIQYNIIRSSQQAWRRQYGRQMPYFFPMPF